MKKIVNRLQACPDSESEQAIIRLILTTVVVCYLYVAGYFDFNEANGNNLTPSLIWLVGLASLVSAWLLLSGIVILPKQSPIRRLLGAVSDTSFINYCLFAMGVAGLPLFFIHLWVIVGNGFRYGLNYLFAASIFSVVGFIVVLLASDHWITNRAIGLGMLIGLVVLPMYMAKLISRLNEALANAKTASQQKTQFLANMSHEMRTPLNGIIGMMGVLANSKLNKDQRGYVDTIDASADALLALVDDVLDISKIEQGKLELDNRELDLPALVANTSIMLEPMASSKGLSLKTNIETDVPTLVTGDDRRLRQVLINLVGNAIKFTEHGGVEVRVSNHADDKLHPGVRFEVIDTGIGIEYAAQKKIFDSFTQADQSTTRRFGGTGLGTTIAKQLVEEMGGVVGLQSTPGQGSRFWFTIPFKLISDETGVEDSSNSLQRAHLLLVRPDTHDRFHIHRRVARWVDEIKIIGSSTQAIEEVELSYKANEPYDIVLIEPFADTKHLVTLPAQLRQIQNTSHTLQLVACTFGDEQQATSLIEAGYDQVLGCPVKRAELFKALHSESIAGADSLDEKVVELHAHAQSSSQAYEVLVADDNEINRLVLQKILEGADHVVTMAEDGDQALALLEQRAFDIAIVDMHMPITDGLDTMRLYRMAYPNRENMPFIILTADATIESREQCNQAGADGFLTKPVNVNKLFDTIDEVIEKRSTRHPLVVSIDSIGAGQAATDAEDVLVDLGMLNDLGDLVHDLDFLQQIIGLFEADSDRLYTQIKQACEDSDFQQYHESIHALKGMSGNLGLTTLFSHASKMHDLTISNFSSATSKLPKLEHLLIKSTEVLQQYKEQLKQSTQQPPKH